MLRTIYFYAVAGTTLILSLILNIRVHFLTKRGRTKDAELFTNKITSAWAGLTLKLTGSKIDVIGLENVPKDQTVLFMSNHQSYFDIPILMNRIETPKGFIAKKELGSWIGIRVWMKNMQCVFMDRSDMRKSAEAIVKGINILKSGHSMVIFPEGTRSKGGKTHEFKSGSFKLATKTKVPIVPITIDGSYNLLELNNDGKIKKGAVKVIIHKPIYVADLTKDELIELPKKVEEIILSPLNQK